MLDAGGYPINSMRFQYRNIDHLEIIVVISPGLRVPVPFETDIRTKFGRELGIKTIIPVCGSAAVLST
jgi:hypothetical protein